MSTRSSKARTKNEPTENGQTKECPDCAETVKAAARKCKHCGYEFAPTLPAVNSLPPVYPTQAVPLALPLFTPASVPAQPPQAPIMPDHILDLLSHLVNKNLVVYEEDEAGQGRYRLLETVRQYSRETLGKSGEADTIRKRHLEFFLTLAEQAQRQINRMETEAGRWLNQLEVEHDNLRMALSFSLEAPEGAEAALRLSYALWIFWLKTGDLTDGRAWLERALNRNGGSQSRERMAALYGAAFLAVKQTDHASAEALATECLSLATHLGEKGYREAPLIVLGYVVSDRTRARGFLEQRVALSRASGDEGNLSDSLADLGMCVLQQNDPASARLILEEAAALAQRSGVNARIAFVRNRMAYLARSEGNWATAITMMEEDLAWQRKQGDRQSAAYTLRDLGMLRLLQGDLDTPRAHLTEAMPMFEFVGDTLGLIRCLEGFALLATAQGHPARAARLFAAAERQRETHDLPLPPVDRGDYDAAPSLRALLGHEAFEAAWAQGQAMSMEQAVAYAVEHEASP